MSNDDIKYIIHKLDKMDTRQDDQAITLTRLTTTVEEHVRRTNILEEELRPIKKHVELVNAGAKIGSIVLTLLLAGKSLGFF